MAEFKNAMEVFKLLDKTNCRKCNKPTCLAFAAAVFQGQAQLTQCPFISQDVIEKHGTGNKAYQSKFEQDYQKELTKLKAGLSDINLEQRAEILGGSSANGKFTIKILGKHFSVDHNGNFSSDIHVNQWITIPVLDYIINSQGIPLSGKWVAFRELKAAKDWTNFFDHQCTQILKKVADTYTNFFEDIIQIFDGRQVQDHYEADISLTIQPLPLLPVLICYNRPEDGLESDLNLFFDHTADKNLSPRHIYTIGAGLAQMFTKLAQTHG